MLSDIIQTAGNCIAASFAYSAVAFGLWFVTSLLFNVLDIIFKPSK